MRHLLLAAVLLTSLHATAQNGPYLMPPVEEQVEIDILSSYYEQDGNNSAVEGGLGTEFLYDISNIIVVNVGWDSVHSINFTGGADYYSSASTDRIDFALSSASSEDVRGYGTATYTRTDLKRGESYGIQFGGSAEYDYNSISTGLRYSKQSRDANTQLNLAATAYFDRWRIFLPIELRGVAEPSELFDTQNRRSYNVTAILSQVINTRLQVALAAEAIWQEGLLSTPFHRVWFADQAFFPGVETLPGERFKLPVSVRLNYFPTDGLVIRTFYRYYYDDFGITAHTASLELPLKLSTAWAVAPFYRYHTQTAADFFAPFGVHTSDQLFFTSDFDLSALSSHNVGVGLRYEPLYGLARARLPGNRLFNFKAVEARGSYYDRSTGLTAFTASVQLSFRVE